ncbi:CPBP family intramembrane glutamic endopeptidase [Halogeometricum sp. CBA1124]|uniref:CPBP family glutamic-type intramembrane protease n=1 Tax=Halogeometricum sp. CBA1124 TaxID=2668071 RepID=UPI0018D270ED
MWTYFALVVACSWTLWFVGLPRTSGTTQLLVVLAGAWSPTVVAVGMATAAGGRAGARRLLVQLLRWRVPLRWYAAAVLSVPLAVGASVAVALAVGGRVPAVTTPGDIGLVAVPVVFLVNVFVGGPLAEELGWRGFALPLLTEQFGARAGAVVVGVVWALWHLPFFVLAPEIGVTGGFLLWAYVPVVVAWSVLVSWVVVNARGSVLLAVLFHAAANTTLGTLAVVSAEAPRLLVAFVVVQVVVAGLVAVVTGRTLGAAADERSTGDW